MRSPDANGLARALAHTLAEPLIYLFSTVTLREMLDLREETQSVKVSVGPGAFWRNRIGGIFCFFRTFGFQSVSELLYLDVKRNPIYRALNFKQRVKNHVSAWSVPLDLRRLQAKLLGFFSPGVLPTQPIDRSRRKNHIKMSSYDIKPGDPGVRRFQSFNASQ